MRLLWEENLLDAIGAIIVAAFTLGMTWIVLEGFMQLHGWFAVLLAFLAALGVLETISRRHYGAEPWLTEARPEPQLVEAPAETWLAETGEWPAVPR